MTLPLLERPEDQAFADSVEVESFEPRTTEAIMAAERAVVGSEDALVDEGFSPDEVKETYETLTALGRAVIVPPTEPEMTVTKMMLTGMTQDQIKQQVADIARQADRPMPRPNFKELDKLPELERQARLQKIGDERGTVFIAKKVDEAVSADLSGVKPVELTPDIARVTLQGIRIEAAKAEKEHREADHTLLLGTARWVIEHTADDHGQAAA